MYGWWIRACWGVWNCAPRAIRCPHHAPALMRSSVLLDQSVIAGVGNIYAAEALWHARISPMTPARQLSAARVTRLIAGIRWTMELALAEQGRHQYRTGTERLAVYDREGEPCLRCGAPIARITQAQRSTYFCRPCQRS
jgi:formamidopyrimidine-DNA glycosylase